MRTITKLQTLLVLFLTTAMVCFMGCKDDDDDKSDKTTNQWIESAMRSYYLWYEEIPDKKELNFNADPEDFFYSLLASEDGKTKNKTRYYYSTIKKKKSA